MRKRRLLEHRRGRKHNLADTVTVSHVGEEDLSDQSRRQPLDQVHLLVGQSKFYVESYHAVAPDCRSIEITTVEEQLLHRVSAAGVA